MITDQDISMWHVSLSGVVACVILISHHDAWELGSHGIHVGCFVYILTPYVVNAFGRVVHMVHIYLLEEFLHPSPCMNLFN